MWENRIHSNKMQIESCVAQSYDTGSTGNEVCQHYTSGHTSDMVKCHKIVSYLLVFILIEDFNIQQYKFYQPRQHKFKGITASKWLVGRRNCEGRKYLSVNERQFQEVPCKQDRTRNRGFRIFVKYSKATNTIKISSSKGMVKSIQSLSHHNKVRRLFLILIKKNI